MATQRNCRHVRVDATAAPSELDRAHSNRGEAAPVLCRDSGCVVSSRDSHLRDERRPQLAALLDASSTVLRLAAPLVDLLVRLSLAKAFFAPGMLPSSDLAPYRGDKWLVNVVRLSRLALRPPRAMLRELSDLAIPRYDAPPLD